MTTPHLTDCCGQHFCEQCLVRWSKMTNGQSCPHCRRASFKHLHDKHFDRSIRDLDIRCSNASHGCEWVGHLSDLSRHLESDSETGCKHHLVECPLNCGERYERRLNRNHTLSNCLHRDVCCEHCGKTVRKFQLKHHLVKCGQVPVTCLQGCGKEVMRHDLERHMGTACPRMPVACPFSDVGCTEKLPRDELEGHTHICKDRHMVKAYEKLLGQVAELMTEMKALKSENKMLALQTLSLREGLRQCYSNTDILKNQLDTTRMVVLEELEFLHTPCKPCEILAIECIRTGIENQLVHLTPAGTTATYRISSYNWLKEVGKVWYSPPFYIGTGYCFRLAVHLNGAGAGKGTHVSICLHQDSGLLDDGLQWPFVFHHNLEIKLMWQEPARKAPLFLSHPSSSSKRRLASPLENKRKSMGPSPQPTERLQVVATPEESYQQRTMSCPTHPSSPNLPRHATHTSLPTTCEVECQVMNISKQLCKPVPGKKRFPLDDVVGKMELFCLQKTCNSMVFLDSIVLKVCLPVGERTTVASGYNDVGWAVWDNGKK